MSVLVRQFLTGGDRNFGYLAAGEKGGEAIIIDPSYSPETIYAAAVEQKLTIRYVFNTHSHHDHSNGNAAMFKLCGIKALAYGDIDPESGLRVEDGAIFPLGELEVKVLHTPGHSADSICLLVDDALFTGDTLFVGKVGGTDFGGGALREYHSLHEKLLRLPDETRVFPGHDVGVSPQSTIGRERKTNPFLLRPDFESFLHLKKTWLRYKAEHGIA